MPKDGDTVHAYCPKVDKVVPKVYHKGFWRSFWLCTGCFKKTSVPHSDWCIMSIRRIDTKEYYNAETEEHSRSTSEIHPASFKAYCNIRDCMCKFILVASNISGHQYRGTACDRACPRTRK